jgi:O-antigen ligase
MWESALEDAANARILGKGLSSFAPNSLVFFPLADPKASYGRGGIGAHSAYIQTIYEMGIVGLLSYLAIFVCLIWRAMRYYQQDGPGVVMLGSIIASYMLVSYSDNMFDYGPVNLYFWGLLGVVLTKWEQLSGDLAAASSTSVLRQRVSAGFEADRPRGA